MQRSIKPSFTEEIKLWHMGCRYVVGLDEVGVGAIAGPIVACAVSLNPRLLVRKLQSLTEVRDSKALSFRKREELYSVLSCDPAIRWAGGSVAPKVIDRINVVQANKYAMKKAIINLQKKLRRKADFLIIDGELTLNLGIPQKSIPKADATVISCAIASILAKVTRDRMMIRYHQKYPHYYFNQNMGYPTRWHRISIVQHGACPIHRRSFRVNRFA